MKNDLFAPVVKRTRIKNGEWWEGDCLELMKKIPDGSIDMILCDLPYGTTQNKWDSVIPFELLWREYWRICKSNAVIALTAQCPFDKTLGASQIQHLKYEWIWQKEAGSGFLNAKKQPLKDHENILIFYREQCVYNPQKTFGHKPYVSTQGHAGSNYGCVRDSHVTNASDGSRYPKSVQIFARDKSKIHPTQKPVALFEYLIKTYTREGEFILDNTAGSGTTAIAAENTGRRWLCIERDPEYSRKAIERIRSCN